MHTIHPLRYLSNKDIEKLSQLHSVCFSDGPMFKFLFNSNQESIQWVSEKRFRLMKKNYLSYVESNYQGFSCWISPEHTQKKITIIKQLLVGHWKSPFRFGINTFNQMVFFAKHEEQVQKMFLKEEAYILDMLAVHPSQQGKGLGGKLIEPVLTKAKLEKRNVYVFTQNEKNVSFYQKHGFKLIDQHPVRDVVNAYLFRIEN